MTDDSNLTPGGEMADTPAVIIRISSDADGHTVEWTKDGVPGSLGPYQDKEMAERVMEAKQQELLANDTTI